MAANDSEAKFSIGQRVRMHLAESALSVFDGAVTYVAEPKPGKERTYIVRFDNPDVHLRMVRESQIEAV